MWVQRSSSAEAMRTATARDVLDARTQAHSARARSASAMRSRQREEEDECIPQARQRAPPHPRGSLPYP